MAFGPALVLAIILGCGISGIVAVVISPISALGTTAIIVGVVFLAAWSESRDRLNKGDTP